jgi:hypothetical protein
MHLDEQLKRPIYEEPQDEEERRQIEIEKLRESWGNSPEQIAQSESSFWDS